MIEIYTDSDSREFKEFVNFILLDIIIEFNEMTEGLSLEELNEVILPWHMRKEHERCKEILSTLYYYCEDQMIHRLDPIYEKVLFEVIRYIRDINTDAGINLFEDVELYKHKYENLFSMLSHEEKKLIDDMKEYDIFLDLCFEDFDFQEYAIEDMMELLRIDVLNGTDYLGNYYHADIEYMDKYIELMPIDIKNEYEKLKGLIVKESKTMSIDEDIIIKEIYNAIIMLENNPRKLRQETETDLSDEIRNIIQAALRKEKIQISREMPSGFAKKSMGEVDLYIYKYINDVYNILAIGENKEWGNFNEQLKQLLGYMKCDTKFGFTILINKTMNLDVLIRKRIEILEKFYVKKDGKKYFQIVGNIQSVDEMKNVIRTLHINPEDNTFFPIYHFIINAKVDEREEAATQARK